MRQEKRKAFTLLELLIVIIIIAVLAIVAIPQYLGAVRSARQSAAINNLQEIRRVESTIGTTVYVTFAATTSPNLTVTLAELPNYTGVINFADPNYKYSVAGTVATAAAQTVCGTCTDYTVNLITGKVTP